MKRPVVKIVGAGLAGCTAAAMLKRRYNVEVIERQCSTIGGLCGDQLGVQWFGPHAFHTNDEDVKEFVMRFAQWKPFSLRVHVMTDCEEPRELPYRQAADPAFRVYSAKAWGMPWEALPKEITERVPTVAGPERDGYHDGIWKAQPVGGYVAMMSRMLSGEVVIQPRTALVLDIDKYQPEPVIWCGDINSLITGSDPLPWIGRQWHYDPYTPPMKWHCLNYATHRVPQLRTYDCGSINPWHVARGSVSEFFTPGPQTSCYPMPGHPASRAEEIVRAAKQSNIWCCGRMGAYRYLDMDATIRNVMDTLKEANLL